MNITVKTQSGSVAGQVIFEEKQKKTLLELLREAQIYLDAPCNGNGSCGKCLVQYEKGSTKVTAAEQETLSAAQLQQGFRLACQSVPQKDAVVVLQSSEEMAVQTKFIEDEKKTDRKDSGENPVRPQKKNDTLGIAVDIGTTTLAAALVDQTTKETICYAVSVNHQRNYGADVITRIQAACEGKQDALQASIRDDLEGLFRQLLEKGQKKKEDIKEIVIAGNTTMCHLLCGFSCEGLGTAPFHPVDLSLQHYAYQGLFDRDTYPATVTILPGISAFVGADIVAGLYSSGMCNLWRQEAKDPKTVLFLDIGTNGEMALLTPGGLFVTSVAAGPALEGGKIRCGMPGIPGAIAKASLLGRQRMITTTILGVPAIGICGTGILEIVSELWKYRIIDENGTLPEQYQKDGFPVAKGIAFTQEDIRQVQMAKAAIRVGMEVLLQTAGMPAEKVDRVLVAGGFGTALNIEKAAMIGLFPKDVQDKIKLLGNSALEGAIDCIKDPQATEEMQQIAEKAVEKNLAMQEDFQEKYIRYMQFGI